MIERYIFGKPIETDAILSKPKAVSWKDTKIIFVDNTLSYDMKDNDIVYGLGQNVRGINKRGWVYISNCADDPIHTETKCSLYGAHNFLILDGSDKFGIFIDTPAPVTFDVGYTIKNQLKITVDNGNFECYMMKEDTLEKIVKAFRGLIGRSYIPPRWAFGYGQSRWGYESAEEIREVVRQHRQNKIPLDSIYLDIDYMEEYKDFTVNENTFPDFQSFVNEMKEENIHLVPIIDAGIKVQDGYPIYEEGKSKGYFCKDEKGEDFIVGVWPGRCCFPDVLNEEAGRWFGNQYKVLLDAGIEGFWNDMNEPAIFYSEKRLKKVFEEIEEYKHQNLDVNSFFQFMDLVNHISSNQEDYESFYHEYKGKKYRHSELHNLFGYYMTRAAAEAFDAMIPGKRILLFSRASYIGMHRYGGVWQGDNCSWWSHLLLNIKMMPSLNMCGFLYTGADIGGFGENVTEDLLIRWLSFGVFTPLMRNHSARGTRTQEVYQFESTELFRTIIEVRYMLLPYLYSEFMKAALEDTMMFRPLGFCYGQDEVARSIEDQLLVGDSIMIAPVYEQNAIGRNVYFPERMKFLRFSKGNIIEEAVYEAGFFYIKMPLGDICVFIRENRILPISTGGEYTEQVDFENLECYSFGENVIPYQNYVDD